ncbi:hypothetical protein [Actinomadura citrea]|uniref:Lipoprotein n=1 Tax=Actinomadura citrea TaxID=46158 RepID=A0A7Y9GI37_9ACTN|nr:hypothetical protein [Actinomadura citrea]NYE16933.1 hypothetical protein [Actinomadura citrea]GGT59010.1 hypothetical protein GCM10010177_14380 [Actinomadura citrea]
MRKIVITGVAAALALGLTACGGNGDGNSAAAPSSPASSAPSESSTPDGGSSPGAPSTPQGSGGSGAPGGRRTPLAQQGGQQITTKWGPLRYLAPGKYTVGNVAFFTATDTVLYVAGGTCPNGTPTPPDVSKCSVDGLDQWVKASPHNAAVRFSGQTATRITETQ